ncbi:MAG: IclR family transcriptional regulator [Ruminococcus sp.]|nr:IclR family transcriptional regulator [Ruminococcus sp.]
MEEQAKVKSLSKAIDILDLLSQNSAGFSLSDISARLGYPKSTVHAMLSTMRDRGLIRQLPSGAYTLGLKLFEYGSAVSRGFDITAVSRPYLERLSAATGATAVITMLSFDAAVSFDYARSQAGVQIMPQIGSRLPLHATSQGKLLLSSMSESNIKNILKKSGMPSFTPHTFAAFDELINSLKEIKAQGYSIEDGEYKIGLRSVSAPVYDSAGQMKYALTTIGFFRRKDAQEFLNAIQQTKKEAMRLSQALGYVER